MFLLHLLYQACLIKDTTIRIPCLFDYYNTILPLTLPPLYFGFPPQNHVMDICIEKTLNLQNRLPLIHVYFVVAYFVAVTSSSTKCCSSITIVYRTKGCTTSTQTYKSKGNHKKLNRLLETLLGLHNNFTKVLSKHVSQFGMDVPSLFFLTTRRNLHEFLICHVIRKEKCHRERKHLEMIFVVN